MGLLAYNLVAFLVILIVAMVALTWTRLKARSPFFPKISSAVALTIPGVFLAWVLIPPFPPLAELQGKNYGQLVEELGTPDVDMSGKFEGWNSGRFVGTWSLEAGFDSPPSKGDVPSDLSRHFFLGAGGYYLRTQKEQICNSNSSHADQCALKL